MQRPDRFVIALCFAVAAAGAGGCGRMILGTLSVTKQDGGSDRAGDLAPVDAPDVGLGVDLADAAADVPFDAASDGLADAASDALADAPSDTQDGGPDGPPRPDPGTVAWVKDGTAIRDDAGRLFLSVDAPATKSFMHVEWDTGEKAVDWSYAQGTLAFRCFVADKILLENQDQLFAMSKAGDFQWSVAVQGNRTCWPSAGIYTESDIDPVAGHSYVYAFRPGAKSLDVAWASNVETLGTAVVRVDAATIYLSSYAAGQTHLKAVRISDGSSQWAADALFASSVMIGFTSDAQGNLYSNADLYSQSSPVSRIDPASGSIMWTYRPPAGQYADVRIDGSTDFLVAHEGSELVAIDKRDRHELWRVNVDPDARYASWYPMFLSSHDLLITGQETLQADQNHMLRVSHSLVDKTGIVRWTRGATPVLLTYNGSNPGRFVWEAGVGQLYSTGGGMVVKLDSVAERLWTFDQYAIERVLGEDGDLVLAAGPPRDCWPCDEGVYAIDKNTGKLRWQMQGQFQSGMSLFASDADRIYLRVPPTGMYEPWRTAAVWK